MLLEQVVLSKLDFNQSFFLGAVMSKLGLDLTSEQTSSK